MKFRYNFEKNLELISVRNIGFEEIIETIKNGNLITIKEHHNQKKYPNQKIMYIDYLKQVYIVPYVIPFPI